MKCKLVGYEEFTITKNKETGEVDEGLSLYFVRKPKLSEANAVGMVSVACSLFGDSVKKLHETVELKVDNVYECDISTYKGKNYLNDIALVT